MIRGSLGLIYNQFEIMQGLQRPPILQTSNWSGTSSCCFLQQTGSKEIHFSQWDEIVHKLLISFSIKIFMMHSQRHAAAILQSFRKSIENARALLNRNISSEMISQHCMVSNIAITDFGMIKRWCPNTYSQKSRFVQNFNTSLVQFHD